MKRITHDTQKIAIKTHEGIQSVTIPDSMQKNLLEYFKFKNKKVFKNFTCHELSHYIVHRTTNRNYKYKIKKMNNFEIGDTILLGTFVKILGKTFVLDVIHSAIYVAQTQEGPLFISKLGRRELVVITTLSELQKIYYDAPNCAKQIWI
jgi:hypothetical protein